MVRITLAHPIEQQPIDPNSIREMLTRKPRRYRLGTEWPDALHSPRRDGDDPSLTLPFCESYQNAFAHMCGVSSIGLRSSSNGRCWTYIKEQWGSAGITKVKEWLNIVGKYVAIRDCLALSFALDYDRDNGDPNCPQTNIGSLRTRAKPYGAAPTADTVAAADELSEHCVAFLREMACYQTADAIVAMPPSSPEKTFDLPKHLAQRVSEVLGLEDLSPIVVTAKSRPPLKDASVGDKLDILLGTIQVQGSLVGRRLILLDDLYQSGTSMNYAAMELLGAGASAVYGLACEKTCRNDDNTSRSS